MSIINNMWNKIEIHPTCYFFLFVAILTGNFIIVVLSSILLLGHECGHFFMAMYFGWPTDKIVFYPFGGIAKFKADINSPLKQELLVLLMGPIIQCIIFYLFRYINLPIQHYQLLTNIHYQILLFNLLPIYPLDGGRILQCFSCYFISYYRSFQFIYYVSYTVIICLFLMIHPSLQLLLIGSILFIRMILEQKKTKYYQEKFLLERYLHVYPFKKKKIVTSDKNFKRDYQHIVYQNKKYLYEKEYLYKKYQKMGKY